MFEKLSEPQRVAYCRAVANLIGADGRTTRGELAALEDLLFALGLDPEEPTLRAKLEEEMRAPGPIGPLVASLPGEAARLSLLRMMVDLAWLDGHLDERERARVAETAEQLGLPATFAEDLGVFIDPPEPDPRQRRLFCEAAAAVMRADEEEAPEELALVRALAERYGLDPEEPELAARLRAPRPLKESLRGIGPRPLRVFLFRFLSEVAHADGEVCYAERAALLEAAEAMELEPALAEELIDWGHEQALAARIF